VCPLDEDPCVAALAGAGPLFKVQLRSTHVIHTIRRLLKISGVFRRIQSLL